MIEFKDLRPLDFELSSIISMDHFKYTELSGIPILNPNFIPYENTIK